MKVIIVEPDKQVVKKVMRVLHTIDPSIQILSVVKNADSLQKRMGIQPFPDLVLVNRQLFGDARHPVEAKLIIATEAGSLVYLAFRVSNLKYLQKHLVKPDAAACEVLSNQKATARAGDEQDDTSGMPVLRQRIKRRFLVTYQQKLLSIAVEEIAYFFSDNRFIFFKTFDNRKFLVEYRMDELENILDPQLFFRVNRSYIISIHSITVIHAYQGNRYKINLTPAVEKEMIVSRERIQNFKKWLGE